jgi:F-type H+-transporting ATPase subunit b
VIANGIGSRLGILAGLGVWLAAGPARPQEAAGGSIFEPHVGLAFWTWVVFLLLLLLLGKTAWKPLLRVLEEREKRIQETLDETRRQRDEAARLLEEHRQMLAGAQRQAQEILAQGRKAAERLKEELLEETRREQEQMLARAREEIVQER